GLIIILLGPYGGALGFALVVCGAGLEKGRIERYILCVFSFFIFTLCSVQGVFHSSNFNTISLFTALCTVMVLFLVDNNSLILILDKLIFVISVTVPIALIIAISQTLGVYPFEFRSNEVLGVMRFTFLFAEPSHYSILLSLCSLISLVKKTNLFTRFILLFGLLMTWSLSGFCIFTFGYIAYK
ncbi:O182 family O-antigen polymerase, partial [Escherichia coli]